MKILMVLEHEFPVDERVEKEALSLINAGHEVHIACSTIKQKPENENYNGIVIHRISSTSFMQKKLRLACLTLPFYFLFWEKHLESILILNSFNSIHIHDLPLAKVGIKLAKRFNLNLVVDFHENYPYMLKEETYTKSFAGKIASPISKWIKYEKKVLRSIDHAICTCQEMKERMQKVSAKPNFFIVENTIDIDRWPAWTQLPKDTEVIRTIYIGGFTIKRGIEVAIKGLSLFNKSSKQKATLDLYGSGKKEYIDSLLKLASDEGVADFVHFKGYISLPKDATTLCSYDVGLIPHLKSTHTDNTSPNKIFHYYYYKLPVLCSDCNYLSRIVNETKGGLIYNNLSAEDFAGKLKILNENKQTDHYGARGYQSIFEKYNWGITATHLIELYSKFTINQI